MTYYQLPQTRNFDHQLGDKRTHLITLENSRGMAVGLTDFGARIVSILVPDKGGNPIDVVLGFDSIHGYLTATETYHGATIGRFANRIAKGRFVLNGESYYVAPNNGPNALHGGANGFHNQVWDRRVAHKEAVDFYYVSADGESGFPGKLSVMVNYRLTDDNELVITYRAETDKPTVLNLTNHNYWNLGGAFTGTIRDHVLMINADQYVPVDEALIPTGELASVAGTPLDFRNPKPIGQDIDKIKSDPVGYDHCYVLRSQGGALALAARVKDPDSGRVMEVYTTQPGMQLYTGNFLTGAESEGGAKQHEAFCLETQHFPDAPNQKNFASAVLRPGETYRQVTVHKFYAE